MKKDLMSARADKRHYCGECGRKRYERFMRKLSCARVWICKFHFV